MVPAPWTTQSRGSPAPRARGDVLRNIARHARFGEYSTHELGIEPEAYDPKLDVDFAPLREQDLTTIGFTEAA